MDLTAAVTGTPGVVGLGLDLVSIDRFAASLRRTRRLADRLFVDSERIAPNGTERRAESLAARFATKEAVAKALGVPTGLDWHDCIVESGDRGRPELRVHGTVAEACRDAGITGWRIALSHDAGIAAAVVVALG